MPPSEETLLSWINVQLSELIHAGIFPGDKLYFIGSVRYLSLHRNWAGAYHSRDHSISISSQHYDDLLEATQRKALALLALEDTLLHELAHHIQHCLHGGCPPHGKEFRAVAAAINGFYQADRVTLYHSLARTPRGREAAAAQRKALALLALTTSSNSHEAEAAAAAFARFASQVNLTLDPVAGALAEALPPLEDEVILVVKQMAYWRSLLLGAVADDNCCKVYWRRSGLGEATQVHLVGRVNRISQASTLLDYLLEALERSVEGHRRELDEAPGLAYWNAFRIGWVSSIAHRLVVEQRRRHTEGLDATPQHGGAKHIPGLVLRSHFEKEHEAVADYLKEQKYRIRPTSFSGSSSDAGRSAGHEAGQRVSLSKQTSGGRGARALAGAAA